MTTVESRVGLRVTCPASTLSKALQAAARAVSTRPVHPIMGNLLLAAGDGLTVTGTDINMTIQQTLRAQVEVRGTTTVSARILSELVASLPDVEVTLEMAEDGWLRVRAGGLDSKLNCLPADEFPRAADAGGGVRIVAPGLLGAVNAAAYAVSKDEHRVAICGLLLEIDEGMAALVATDGHRLAVHRLGAVQSALRQAQLIIPSRALIEARRAFKDEAAVEILVAEDQRRITIDSPTATLETLLVDGVYPRYRQAIPQRADTTVRVARAEMVSAVRTVRALHDRGDDLHGLRLSASGDSLKVSASTAEVGEAHVEVASHIAGQPGAVQLNADYIKDTLDAVRSDEVELRLAGPNAPVVIVPAGGDGESLHVMMPIRS